MNSSDYQRAKSLFSQALALAPEARADFLASATVGEPALRRFVEELLRNDEDPHAFVARDLEGGGAKLLAQEVASDASDRAMGEVSGADIPKRIGQYRIVRHLGSGGMGSVYEAEQDNPRRTVAVKIVRPGSVSRATLRRFVHEAHLLGRLQHPGIARIYEGGTAEIESASGVMGKHPFFAMELIRGNNLLAYARERALSVPNRLQLITKVCEAVHHAHQKSIIHRDLKPANILVDDAGQPKILDFGIARVTDSDVMAMTTQTDAGQLLGTIPYMSPEQAVGDSAGIDVRSDLYSIGVILYELLTDRLPLDVRSRSIVEAARIIREQEPPSIGSINPVLKGDLSTVIAKSLAKDRERRYQSAAELGTDIRSFLNNEPIRARPATATYLLRKFARRNKALVAGVALAFVSLSAGLTASTLMYLRSERAASKARAINDFILQEVLSSSDPWKKYGRDVKVVDVLDNAADAVSTSLAEQPELESEIRMTLANAFSGLGLHERSGNQASRALELRRNLYRGVHPNLVTSLVAYSGALRMQGLYEQSEPIAYEAVDMARRLGGSGLDYLISSLVEYGRLQMAKSGYKEAETVIRESVALCQELPPHSVDVSQPSGTNALQERMNHVGAYDETDPIMRKAIAYAENALLLGELLYKTGRYAESQPLMRSALSVCSIMFEDDNPRIAYLKTGLSAVLDARGDYPGSVKLARESLAIYEVRLGADHPKTLQTMRGLGDTLRTHGELEESESLLRDVLDKSQHSLGEDHPSTLVAANTLALLLHKSSKKLDEAQPIYEDTLQRSTRVLGEYHRDTLTVMYNLAWLYRQRGVPAKAKPLYYSVISGFKERLGDTHPDTITVMEGLAEFLVANEDYAEAEGVARDLLRIKRSTKSVNEIEVADALEFLATVLLKQGDSEQARSDLTELRELLAKNLPDGSWRIASVDSKLGACMAQLGAVDIAEQLLVNSYQSITECSGVPPHAQLEALDRIIAFYDNQKRLARSSDYRAQRDTLESLGD